MAGWGGKRANVTGRKKGTVLDSTLRKKAVREYFLKRFTDDQAEFYESQKASAVGHKFLVVKDKATGKFTPVTEAMAKMLAQDGDGTELVEVWERAPSTQAFVALADRSIDKPTEHTEVTGADKGPLVLTWKTPER